jgi:hypothetical protein
MEQREYNYDKETGNYYYYLFKLKMGFYPVAVVLQ